MIHAVTSDPRYAPGMELIAHNGNLRAENEELRKQLEFYKRMWALTADDLETMTARYNSEVVAYTTLAARLARLEASVQAQGRA